MHRFYCPQADFSVKEIILTDRDEIHHARHVLRLKPQDTIYLFNGKGEEAQATIQIINADTLSVKIDKIRQIKSSRNFILVLACAIPKKAKFEYIIEKCTELGVDEIIPLMTKRTEIHLSGEKAQKKAVRFQTVAVNAAKQCKRTTVPKIYPPTDMETALKQAGPESLAFIPCLSGNPKHLRSVIAPGRPFPKMIFFIGPEGDFTPQEVQMAIEQGCIPVSLGENVLKVDTAAISVIALANLLF